jgi:hypothetical protein
MSPVEHLKEAVRTIRRGDVHGAQRCVEAARASGGQHLLDMTLLSFLTTEIVRGIDQPTLEVILDGLAAASVDPQA